MILVMTNCPVNHPSDFLDPPTPLLHNSRSTFPPQSADNALTSNQFTAALELSSQAIGLVEDQGLVRTADPWNSQTKALLLANRAEARATLGITVEATRDCVEVSCCCVCCCCPLGLIRARMFRSGDEIDVPDPPHF